MINSVMTIPCGDCKGQGYVFFGDKKDYSVESCQCQDVNLFNTPESN